MTQPDNHWLTRPNTIRWLWIGGCSVLAATVLLQWIVPIKGYFGIDGWFGFAALFGFFSCVLMVFGAKVIGKLIKRPDTYYDV
ncbi:MAG: hypothetical protein NWQ24_10185 [Haliea sp.]|jgi:amino acid transporter|nr:hypothetical protein [Haliea sp.]MDP4789015.1 hypothetical protein [Haliea sp.]MDP5065034.1 hypothetical protein [Haliea sp.]